MTAPAPAEVNELLERAPLGAPVYLIAAGGCGMSGLAHLLLDLGFTVIGSDLVENDVVEQLRSRGAIIHCGHRAAQLRAAAPVLVVYSSAIRADNPEIQAAREMNVPIVRRAVLLAALARRKTAVCVAGMHGKTTTTALLAFALTNLRAAPSYAVGASVPQLAAHARLEKNSLIVEAASTDASGHGPQLPPSAAVNLFVLEADESDGTLREFEPVHGVLLNVDEEHLDYFVNVQNICREFEEFAFSASGVVVYCADDARLATMMARHPRAVSYGFHPLAEYRLEMLAPPAHGGADEPFLTSFAVWRRGARLADFSIRLFGEKNVSNAGAAVALLHQLGFDPERIGAAIADFRGAARRQQELYADEQTRVFDDYGHHPNEIRATLNGLKRFGGRLLVAFQPHRFTRTLHLMRQFSEAFADADRLVLTEVYAASEPEIPGANSAVLTDLLRARGQNVDYVPRLGDVAPAVLNLLRPGDTVVFMGAGSITEAAHECAAALRQRFAPKFGARTMNSLAIEKKLRAVLSPATAIHAQEPLSKRTTLRVGGNADWFIEPASEEDLSALLRLCGEIKLPFTIVGRGSNLLIRDGGVRGVVICLGHEGLSKVRIVGEHLHCGAGAKLKTVATEARRAGLAGLEFLEGIPGSVGGALRMNAGAMGSWMFEVVEQIRFMDFNGNVQERTASEVNVEYRGCPLFKTHIALGAVLRGTPAPKEVIQERARQFNAKRWESQPAQPSAGCIFKNPTTIPAGKLIDELGLKGARRGGAMVSTVHGNFIVNDGHATANDVLELIEYIKQTAKARRGIVLETEVEIVGE